MCCHGSPAGSVGCSIDILHNSGSRVVVSLDFPSLFAEYFVRDHISKANGCSNKDK